MNLHLVLLFLHVVGAGVVIGVIVMAFAAIVRPPLTRQSIDRFAFVGRFGMYASGSQFVTGAALMALEWGELGKSTLLWIKIILWVVEGMLASMVIEKRMRQLRTVVEGGQPVPRTAVPALVVVQLVLILTIAAIGVYLVSGPQA